MTDTKFTPGPWVNDNGLVSGRCTRHPDTPSFDIFDAADWPGDENEALANAHLIASAPCLYRELAEMVELFHGYQGMELTRAKAALAKARGETS